MKLAIALAASGLLLATPAFAGQTISLPSFNGVEASDGAHVTIRHGASQQVTIVEGSTQISRFDVRDGKLHIVTCDGWHCPHNYSLKVTIVLPNLASVEASDGASLETEGPFPAQPNLSAKATDGGRVDARALRAAHVHAKADDGGDLLVHADGTIDAAAEDGGNINYWGKATVSSLVARDGGNVNQED